MTWDTRTRLDVKLDQPFDRGSLGPSPIPGANESCDFAADYYSVECGGDRELLEHG